MNLSRKLVIVAGLFALFARGSLAQSLGGSQGGGGNTGLSNPNPEGMS